ncbi:MAG: hypothetical protein ACRCZ9_08235 [Fusobacteriaceae bacterium]
MKKTLFVNSESEESKRVINLLEGRIDYIILELNSNLENRLDVTSAPTLVVEDWEEVLKIVGFQKIEEYLLDEPTPNYPCVCSE